MSNVELFISHSSNDRELAGRLTQLISGHFEVPRQAIRCSSVPGYRLELGALTGEQLQQELRGAKVVLAVLTPSSLAAPWVLYEMGAAWGLAKTCIPLLAGDIDDAFKTMPDPLRGPTYAQLASPGDLWRLLTSLEERLGWARRARRQEETAAAIEGIVGHVRELYSAPNIDRVQIFYFADDRSVAERLEQKVERRSIRCRKIEGKHFSLVLEGNESPAECAVLIVSQKALQNEEFKTDLIALATILRDKRWRARLVNLDGGLVPRALSWLSTSEVRCEDANNDRHSFDNAFQELWRFILQPLPPWLGVQCLPSLMSKVTGVGWDEPDEFVFADQHFRHAVKVTRDRAVVLKDDLAEPFHLDFDRGAISIANVGANEVPFGRVTGDRLEEGGRIREAAGRALKRPHGVYQGNRHSLIADTDNNRILYKEGSMRAPDKTWDAFSFDVDNPCAVSMDSRGVWIADTFRDRLLYVYLPEKRVATVSYREPDAVGRHISRPVAVRALDDRFLFVSNEGTKSLELLEYRHGKQQDIVVSLFETRIASRYIGQPLGISLNRSRHAMVADRERGCC